MKCDNWHRPDLRTDTNWRKEGEYIPMSTELLDKREEFFRVGSNQGGSAWLMALEVVEKLREAQVEIARLSEGDK